MFRTMMIEIYCDSSHKGYGIYIPQTEQHVSQIYDYKVTTNEGEFLAMEAALLLAKHICMDAVMTFIYSDSQLVVNALTKGWRVRAVNLIDLNKTCNELYTQLIPHGVKVQWIPREKNKIADLLSKGKKVN